MYVYSHRHANLFDTTDVCLCVSYTKPQDAFAVAFRYRAEGVQSSVVVVIGVYVFSYMRFTKKTFF